LLSDAASERITRSPASARRLGGDPLAPVLHELATKRKHGAFVGSGGQLSVEWAIHTNGGAACSEWKERNGPKVAVPRDHGFGTTSLRRP
jgi:two-component sensor histidine kinase